MSLAKPSNMDLKYFLGEFHSGNVNRITHAIGFGLLIYGLIKRDWLLDFVISPLFMESGHFYNHFVLNKYKSKGELIRLIPIQILGWLLSIGFIAVILRLFKKI